MVDAGDSKSPGEIRAGSIPASGTTISVIGIERDEGDVGHLQTVMCAEVRRFETRFSSTLPPFCSADLTPPYVQKIKNARSCEVLDQATTI